MHPVTGLRSALFGRHAVGVLVLSMLMTNAPPPITLALLIGVLSILDTPTLAVTVRQLQPDFFVTNWRLHMRMQSGTTLTPVMKGLTFSCVVATL